MAISEDELAAIREVLAGPEADAWPALRSGFPHLTLTRCDASDVTEAPFEQVDGYDLHLLDASGHCAEVTSDLSRATGLVLAKRRAEA